MEHDLRIRERNAARRKSLNWKGRAFGPIAAPRKRQTSIQHENRISMAITRFLAAHDPDYY